MTPSSSGYMSLEWIDNMYQLVKVHLNKTYMYMYRKCDSKVDHMNQAEDVQVLK